MKTRFAKFVDRTLGAALLFAVLTAVLRYYTTTALAAFSAAAITASLYFMFGIIGRNKADGLALTRRADEMFADFMFESRALPARKLCSGLKSRGVDARVLANAVYAGKCAAFFSFDAPLDTAAAARIIARAKRNGADKATVFCRKPPSSTVSVKDFTLDAVSGDDVYKLFASLDALPEHRFERTTRSRTLRGILDKNKIPRYALLSAAMFGVSAITGFSIVPLVCASVAAVLFITASIFHATAKIRAARNSKQS